MGTSNDYDVVDCHIHLFRTEREGWQGRSIEDRWDAGGSLEQLLRYMGEAGVSAGWIINGWPTEMMRQSFEVRLPGSLSAAQRREADQRIREVMRERCARKNGWLCQVAKIHPGRFAPMIGGVDPYFGTDWIVKEIEQRHKEGARGVKIISTWGAYYPHDKALWPAYDRLQELGMVILAHCGGLDSHATISGNDYALPHHWEPVLRDFPKLKLVLAHLGYLQSIVGYGTNTQRLRVELARKFPENVYFDLSVAFEEGYDTTSERLIREAGVERCVWASDWHAHRAVLALEGFKRSSFTEEEKRLILGETARRLIQL